MDVWLSVSGTYGNHFSLYSQHDEDYMIEYRILSLISSGIAILLFISLLFVPEPIFILFGIGGNESAYFIARRAAMLFLMLAVIAYFSRHAQHTDTRQSILLGLTLSMFGLAMLGTFEFVRGFAGVGIFLAVGAELFLAVSYGSIWLLNRKCLPTRFSRDE
jgi:hypothetical protein